jgi:hypothetical protein
MNAFWLWFSTGLEHILDWNGYDHILYIMALCALFSVKEWKQLLVLVTAFTIGHSLTLAASTLHILTVKQGYIEALIPLTILITCLVNIYFRRRLIRFIGIKITVIGLITALLYFLALYMVWVFHTCCDQCSERKKASSFHYFLLISVWRQGS